MSKGQSKKSKAGRNNFRITIMNITVFVVVALTLLWIVKRYLHIGDTNYTNDAQVTAFINPINSRVSAYIKEIRYSEHQQVEKGDTLVILDDREIQTQLGQAEAAYMNAKASKNVSASSINTLKSNLAVADANIAGAKARLWRTKQDYLRYKSLLEDEAVTRQQFEQMKTQYESQKAQYESLVSQSEASQFSVKEGVKKIALNEAEIKRSEAALEMARLNLSYTVITAPYDGFMGRRKVNVGQLIQVGQQIGTIVDNTMWIVANYRETQMSKIKVGKKVFVKIDGLNGKSFEGVITAISKATGAQYSAVPVDNSTGNFVKVQQRIPVRIELTASNRKEDLDLLRAGMNVEVNLKQDDVQE